MTADSLADVPYERQQGGQRGRMCGAASLCMAYRSLGIDADQMEVWPRIATGGSKGRLGARTYLLARDALSNGLTALVLQTSNPWSMLQRCHEQAVRVIVNHRSSSNSRTGHFSVAIAIDEEHITLHDPGTGPCRRIERAQFLALWRPRGPHSEIAGNILVAIASPAMNGSESCQQCGRSIPQSTSCPDCDKPIKLEPRAVLGCVDATCEARFWSGIFCPQCDARLMTITSR